MVVGVMVATKVVVMEVVLPGSVPGEENLHLSEVLELLIKLLEAEEDRWARDSITRSIKSLEERLRTLAGSGRKPVLLHDRGG